MILVSLYSIGHSSHSMTDFVKLLKKHKIETVADVRRAPYSGRYPRFNKKELEDSLAVNGFKYFFLGNKLGGLKGNFGSGSRVMEQKDYDKLVRSEEFSKGIDELTALACESRTAVMCSEGDPERCHRSFLITPALFAKGVAVVHIFPDGKRAAAVKSLFD